MTVDPDVIAIENLRAELDFFDRLARHFRNSGVTAGHLAEQLGVTHEEGRQILECTRDLSLYELRLIGSATNTIFDITIREPA